MGGHAGAAEKKQATGQLKGRIKQGACRGAFGRKVSLDQMCQICVDLGLKGSNPLPEKTQLERLIVRLGRPREALKA